MPNIDLSILNQRQTPAFYASSLATRPAFGFAGRIFIDTDSPSTGLYRDTGAAWVQIADPGAGTTGTLQQVTTNGNTTTQGITITAGGLSTNNLLLNANTGTIKTTSISQSMANNDIWEIYGIGNNSTGLGEGELVFSLGDDATPYASGGERFRFTYGTNIVLGTPKDVFIVDYDLSYFNTNLGINTPTPGAAIDAHSSANIIQQLNQTVATNNSLLAFQNNNVGLWRIGNFYNAGANDWGIFDVVGAIQPVTVKKTTGQVLIGTSTVGSGKLVVASATGDNGIQIVGATAPSLRIDNAESGPTKRAGFGISTATNNFIQGSADRDFCMFNGSTTASPILFGIYDAGAVNVQEAARISAARNFLIGTTTDTGQKLQVSGQFYLSSAATVVSYINTTNASGASNVYQQSNVNVGWIGNGSSSLIGGSTNDFTINGVNNLNLAVGGFGRAIINSSGNVGIGTTSPDQKLVINQGATGTNQGVPASSGSTQNGILRLRPAVGVYGETLDFGMNVSPTYGWLQSTNASSLGTNYALSLNPNGGNLLIGTTTDNGNKLQVNGVINQRSDANIDSATNNTVGTSFVSIMGTNSRGLFFASWFNTTGGAQGSAVFQATATVGITMISNADLSGAGVIFQYLGGVIQARTTTGQVAMVITTIGTA